MGSWEVKGDKHYQDPRMCALSFFCYSKNRAGSRTQKPEVEPGFQATLEYIDVSEARKLKSWEVRKINAGK